MEISQIPNLTEAEKTKLLSMAISLTIDEQSVIVSELDDSVLIKELEFRLEDRKNKIINARFNLGGLENGCY